MTIITNPPFKLCNNKKYLLEMQSKKDAVILATFKFCNRLGQWELIDAMDWPDITYGQTIAIYSSYENRNSVEQPDFYEKWLTEYEEGWVTTLNPRLHDMREKSYLNPVLVDLKPEMLISKGANQYMKIGDPIKRKVYPKNVYEIFKKHKDEILYDTYLWRNSVIGYIKIRKEFFE